MVFFYKWMGFSVLIFNIMKYVKVNVNNDLIQMEPFFSLDQETTV